MQFDTQRFFLPQHTGQVQTGFILVLLYQGNAPVPWTQFSTTSTD